MRRTIPDVSQMVQEIIAALDITKNQAAASVAESAEENAEKLGVAPHMGHRKPSALTHSVSA